MQGVDVVGERVLSLRRWGRAALQPCETRAGVRLGPVVEEDGHLLAGEVAAESLAQQLVLLRCPRRGPLLWCWWLYLCLRTNRPRRHIYKPAVGRRKVVLGLAAV